MRQNILPRHVKNTKKLSTLEEIKLNPFLWPYLANFYMGNSNYDSLATVAILPRILGTSITTTFGNQMQKLIVTILDNASGSAVSGIDIEYIDAIDGRKKYCQLKSGPQALNKDDITTIKNHFRTVQNLARTNNLPIQQNDLVFAMVYGEPDECNSFVKKLAEEYEVYIGKEFWHRLTGYEDFYFDLSKAMTEDAETVDSRELIKETIDKLARDIESKYPK